jgi:hypothetical protein
LAINHILSVVLFLRNVNNGYWNCKKGGFDEPASLGRILHELSLEVRLNNQPASLVFTVKSLDLRIAKFCIYLPPIRGNLN